MNTQDLTPLGWTGWISLQSKRLSRIFANTQFKSINSSVLSFLYSPTLTPIHDYWKNHSLEKMDLCWQSNVSAFECVIEVGHNFPSKEQASFNFMVAVTICSDFGGPKKKVSTVSPSICHEVWRGGLEKMHLIQVKEQQLHFPGAKRLR